jgi:hypothetical protein
MCPKFCFVLFCFSLKEPTLIHHKCFWNIGTPLKIEAQRCFPLRAPFIVFIYESSTLGKAYRIKGRCYWEHIGKSMGTQREHIGDNRKSLHPPAKPKKKQTNWALMSACSASHLLHENHGHKTICHHCPLLFPIFAYHNHYFLKEFWCSLTGYFIGRCRKVGDHPQIYLWST